MLTEFRHGALAVVENVKSKDEIQRALKRIDPRLFVEKQMTLAQEEVWCVVCDVGLNHPPITFFEWRDEQGRPISHLSERIVARVAQMEREGDLVADCLQRNAALVREKREQAQRQYEEIAADMIPRIEGRTSALLPRGQYLRRHRDKLRAQGFKV